MPRVHGSLRPKQVRFLTPRIAVYVSGHHPSIGDHLYSWPRPWQVLQSRTFRVIGQLPDTAGAKASSIIWGFSLTYRSRSERLSSSAACSPASLSQPCLSQSLSRPYLVLQGSQERARTRFSVSNQVLTPAGHELQPNRPYTGSASSPRLHY